MELKLNIYADRFCRRVERTVTANTFDLSTGICEDVLDIINIDMFEGGLSSLSNESMQEIAIGIVRNGFPFFVELCKELFELTDDEVRHTKIEDIAKIVVEIVKYSFTQLASSLGGKKAKN
jgi:hypothetical protein